MKKNSIPKFCLILDNRNSQIISELQEEDKLEIIPGMFQSIPTTTERLFKLYLALSVAIEAELDKTKGDAQFVIINDLRCSLGNSLEFMGMSFLEDKIFPGIHSNSIALKGYEPSDALLEEAQSLLARLTPNVELQLGGFGDENPMHIFEELKMETVEPGDINIVICPHIFEDGANNVMLEEQIIAAVPVGTFLIFPNGIKGGYAGGLEFCTKEIFRKESVNVKRVH